MKRDRREWFANPRDGTGMVYVFTGSCGNRTGMEPVERDGTGVGVGVKIFGGQVHPFLELHVFRHHWSRSVVEFCMGIAICRRQNFGQVWGSSAPLPEVTGKLRCRKAPLWTFD